MKKIILPLFLLICSLSVGVAQQNILRSPLQTQLDENLKPFYHGVASGDPLFDRVIIWTRVTPEKEGEIQVNWKVATDVAMTNIVKSGKTKTDNSKDYTVKIDVAGLKSNTTYYYQFTSNKQNSLIGRTKTTPEGADVKQLRFAVVSCSNYQAGFFNAYKKISERNDLDAVIHLGDYIYEYGEGKYGDSTLSKTNQRSLTPKTEIIKLEDYRGRYSTYRLDPDLIKAHQQHPFITIWDDHESANDAYKEGAQNHNEQEGEWLTRKSISKKVYAEWMPIRGDAEKIYRIINYGNLMDLIMLDTRLEGREKQIRDVTNADLYSESRTILGKEQKDWFLKSLSESKAQWKVIGNQVVFSEFNVGWAASAVPNQTPEGLENLFLDIWDGYPAERKGIINFLETQKINDLVFITGDIHSAFAFDVALRPSVFSQKGTLPTYNAETGEGAVAVEFVSPSITSANYDENIGLQRAKMLEYQMNKTLPASPPNNVNPNPHMKFVDLVRHGYFILDITEEKAQADWYFMDTILQKSYKESFSEGWYTKSKENHLRKATNPSTEKSKQEIQAPGK